MIATEYELTGRKRWSPARLMHRNLEVMKAFLLDSMRASLQRIDWWRRAAKSLDHYIQSERFYQTTLCWLPQKCYCCQWHNAKMGLVTPTAGSAGCLPAVPTSAIAIRTLRRRTAKLISCRRFYLSHYNNASLKVAVKLRSAPLQLWVQLL